MGTYPSDWKKILIIPIFKKRGSINDVNQYRGIGLLSTFQKIFNKVLQTRLYAFAERENILPRFQAGFRRDRSTVDHVFVVQTIAGKYLRRGQPLYACFVDFSKFFDSIQRDSLWAKLARFGVSKKILEILMSMYSDTSFAVRFKADEVSSFCSTKTGVIQGDVLSPLLANLFTADLPDFLRETASPHFAFLNNRELISTLFADDLALLSSSPVGLQRQLNKLNGYCNSNGLEVSPLSHRVHRVWPIAKKSQFFMVTGRGPNEHFGKIERTQSVYLHSDAFSRSSRIFREAGFGRDLMEGQ